MGKLEIERIIKYIRQQDKFNIYVIRDGGWWIPIVQDFRDEDHESPKDVDIIKVLGPDTIVCFNKYSDARRLGIKVVNKLIRK